MALVLSESFTAGIPAGFATTVLAAGSGALTATYNSAQAAVDLNMLAFNGAWMLDAAGTNVDVRLVLDIEQLVADNGDSSASGIGLAFRAATEGVYHVFAMFTESNVSGGFRGTPGDPLAGAINEGTTLAVPSLAGRNTLQFVVVRAGLFGARQCQIFLGDRLVYVGQVQTVPVGEAVSVGVYIRDCRYRVHSVDVYDDASPLVPQVSRYGVPAARLSPLPQALLNHINAVPTLLHDAADGGPLRVAGTVKIDGTPATPVARKVRLFDVISGRLVRQQWSGIDGAFGFERIRAGEYMVISDDHTRTYNAVVADKVLAVP